MDYTVFITTERERTAVEENRLKNHLRKLKEDLGPMSWKERMDHLWTYYKWVAGLLILLLVFLNIAITAVVSAKTEILFSGIGINVPMTESGITCLSDEYLERLGGGKRRTVQYLDEVLDFENTVLGQETSYSTIVKVTGMLSTNALDYLLLDQKALDYYYSGDLFLDLNQVFSEEELAQMPVSEVNGRPLLLDLAGTWFADTYITDEGPYYLAFVYTTTHAESCHDFWQYLQTGN